MKFEDAQAKLTALARGKCHSVAYKVITYGDGMKRADCELYMEDKGLSSAPTWREAFEKLMFPSPPQEPAPEIDDEQHEVEAEQ